MASVGRVISFRSQNLQPVAYIRKAEEASFEIVLKPASLELPAQTCSTEKSQRLQYGQFVMFNVPRGIPVQRGLPDADNVRFFVSAPKSKNEKLILWSGPLLGGGFNNEVPEEWLLRSSSFSERQIWGGLALDAKGKSSDGKNWRYVSSFMDIVQYHDVSDDTAHFFDQIIDSACVRQAASSQTPKKN